MQFYTLYQTGPVAGGGITTYNTKPQHFKIRYGGRTPYWQIHFWLQLEYP